MSEHDNPTPEPAFGTVRTANAEGAAAIIEVAKESVDPTALDANAEGVIYSVVGADGGVRVLDLERYRDRPERPRGTYYPATVEAFINYVSAHHAGMETTVWVHPTEGQVVAVLDDHDGGLAGWGKHRAELSLLPTPEWTFWSEKDGELMGQQEFAELIEGGVRQIREPNAADMLEIAQSFHATTDANFRSKIVLASGEVRMAYDETIDAKAGQSGDIKIPQEFELAIAPFIGEDEYKVMARFRYRVRNGNLQLGYSLIEPELVVRDALERIADRITARFEEQYESDGRRVYLGRPPELGAAGR